MKLPSEDSQSEIIFPLPPCPASETCIELELDSDNSEEYSTSSKTDDGTQNASEEEGDLDEKDRDILDSGRTLINVDELLMKDTISQSELRTVISIGPDSSSQTCYSYLTDEDGKAFPISIFGDNNRTAKGLREIGLGGTANVKHYTVFRVVFFRPFLAHQNQVFQSRKAVLSGRNSMIK